jgi:hypothetical protein
VTHHRNGRTFSMGMYDPRSGSYAPLGTHLMCDREKIINGLKDSIERAGHKLSLSVKSER